MNKSNIGLLQAIDDTDQELQGIIDDLLELLERAKKHKAKERDPPNQKPVDNSSHGRHYNGTPPWVDPFYLDPNFGKK